MFHFGVGFLLLTSSESFVGPFHYSPTATVGMLKEIIVSEWPKDELRVFTTSDL